MKKFLLVWLLLTLSAAAQTDMMLLRVGRGTAGGGTPVISCAMASGSSASPSVTIAITSGHRVISALWLSRADRTLSAWKTSNNDAITAETGYPATFGSTVVQQFGHGTATGSATSVSISLSGAAVWALAACDVTVLTALDVADTAGHQATGAPAWTSGSFTSTATDSIFGFAVGAHNVTITCTDTQGAIVNDATNDVAAILCYRNNQASGAGKVSTGTVGSGSTSYTAIAAGYKP